MDLFSHRKYTIIAIFSLITLIFLIRLVNLQLVDTRYRKLARKNIVREITVYPARGLVYDRNNKLIAYNEVIYDLKVVPKQVSEFDTSLLLKITGLKRDELDNRFKKALQYSSYKPSIIEKQISVEVYNYLQEHFYKFPGFYAEKKAIRRYTTPYLAHALGYLNEVGKKQVADGYYELGDQIGITGIEKKYEAALRGEKGKKYVMVDVHGREQGEYSDKFFIPAKPVAGIDLITSIDLTLQQYGEKLMSGKKGSVIAIEPSSGEILAFVSAPSYDPNLLTGRNTGGNFRKLSNDTLIPLYNRAIMAQYSPGSTFKLIMALIGLEEGVLTKHSTFYSPGVFTAGNLRVGDHAPPGWYNVEKAIRLSSNTYFCALLQEILSQEKYDNTEHGFNQWKMYLDSFNLGETVNIDLPNEARGLTPTAAYYNKLYGENRWRPATIISVSIGQGELLVTPVQLANLMVAIANRGYYYAPHIAKQFKSDSIQLLKEFQVKRSVPISEASFEVVIGAMESVVNNGTAVIAKLPGIPICGKTGTVENPHGEDHSVFSCFAPREEPKIAIAVVVENAGYGATWAAPIASLMIEKYMTDTISRRRKWLEKRIMEKNFFVETE